MATILEACLYLVACILFVGFRVLASPIIIAEAYPQSFITGVIVAFGICLIALWKKRSSISSLQLFFYLWSPILLLVFTGSFIAGVVAGLIPLKFSMHDFYWGTIW